MTNAAAQTTLQQPERRFAPEQSVCEITDLHYERFVHEMAVKITTSPEEADAAICEMMSDIRRTAAGPPPTFAQRLRDRIAMMRLLKLLG